VGHVERIPLGTPYPIVVEKIRMVTQHEELAGRCEAVVDATGLGAPVVEMLRSAGRRRRQRSGVCRSRI
jgi:hypothetical protein